MRYTLLLIVFAFTLAGCALEARSPAQARQADDDTFLFSKPALLLYGLLAGVAGGILLMTVRGRRYKSTGKQRRKADGKKEETDTTWREGQLEHQVFRLEEERKEYLHKYQDLKRRLDEAEQLSRADLLQKDTRQDTGNDKATPEAALITLYFLQPTTDGWFRENGKVAGRADAVYELSYHSDNPFEATIQFIDTPGNTDLAIRNEDTWILIACERSNIATTDSRSVKTDVPGIARFKDHSWQIVQKAKITYQ